jgi:hypothetical protein
MWGALSDERTGLSFTIAACPCQRSHSRGRVSWGWWPYFTVSDSRRSFSSPPTTRRVSFNPASTREWTVNSSQSQSHIATDSQSVSKSWCRAPYGAHDQIFIMVWQLRSCFCGAPSLRRGRICLLYMLLALSGEVILASESLETRDHILLSQIRDFSLRRLLRLAGTRWRYSTPPPHGETVNYCWFLAIIDSGRTTAQKTYPLPSSWYVWTHIVNISYNTGSVLYACITGVA